MSDPTNRVIRFLISISAAGVALAALISRLPWDNIATASR